MNLCPASGVGKTLLILAFIGCVAFQLFVPPSIGLANNGDFAKMVGRFSLAPGTLDSSDENKYFTSRWVYNREYRWVSDTGVLATTAPDASTTIRPKFNVAPVVWLGSVLGVSAR